MPYMQGLAYDLTLHLHLFSKVSSKSLVKLHLLNLNSLTMMMMMNLMTLAKFLDPLRLCCLVCWDKTWVGLQGGLEEMGDLVLEGLLDQGSTGSG